MDIYTPLIEEFIARKEHILNLETRLFVITLMMQIIFIIFVYNKNKNRNFLPLLVIPFLFFLFESIAINGKMGLISTYLKQLELFLENKGFVGVVWESKALEKIIFPVGNAFTLPALFAIIILLSETFYILKVSLALIVKNKFLSKILIILIFFIIFFITIKSLTVDFFVNIPNVFDTSK